MREGEKNVFGEVARSLPRAQLPTNKDIGLQLLHFQQLERLRPGEAVERTAQEVEKLYRKASIPTITFKSIRMYIGGLDEEDTNRLEKKEEKRKKKEAGLLKSG